MPNTLVSQWNSSSVSIWNISSTMQNTLVSPWNSSPFFLLEHIISSSYLKWQSYVLVLARGTRENSKIGWLLILILKCDNLRPASMSVRYLMPASLSRVLLRIVFLCTGLISTLLSLAGSSHKCTLPLALSIGTKLLHHSDVSSTPNNTIMCCFCNLSSSSLSRCWHYIHYPPGLVLVGTASLFHPQHDCALKKCNSCKSTTKFIVNVLLNWSVSFSVCRYIWNGPEII